MIIHSEICAAVVPVVISGGDEHFIGSKFLKTDEVGVCLSVGHCPCPVSEGAPHSLVYFGLGIEEEFGCRLREVFRFDAAGGEGGGKRYYRYGERIYYMLFQSVYI